MSIQIERGRCECSLGRAGECVTVMAEIGGREAESNYERNREVIENAKESRLVLPPQRVNELWKSVQVHGRQRYRAKRIGVCFKEAQP